MKGLYIAPVDCKSKIYIGVCKKINYQINAFKSLGIDMDYVNISGKNINFLNENLIFNTKHFKQPIFFKKIIKNLNKFEKQYDFVYIRFSFANPYIFSLSKKLKKKRIKVFIEIPTYPYTEELEKSVKNSIYKCMDKFLWKYASKNIYRLVLTNDKEQLFGIKAVNIFNGIDSNEIDINKSMHKKKEKEINLIGVANISKWHGYDRVISGLYEYYKKERNIEVHFYIVGDGKEKNFLNNLCNKLKMNRYVHIVGTKYGEDLDVLYNRMNIGVSSLALFRAGGGHDPIKSKEYIAKGIPVIIGYEDRALPNNLEFVYKVPENNLPINIEEIVTKYRISDINANKIVQYAIDNLTWKSQIRKVIAEI